MPFPNRVNITQAPGVAGDFASVNPRHSALSVEGGFIAGPSGLYVARFAWLAPDSAGVLRVLNNSGVGAPAGFVHRNMNALITTYLTEYGMMIPPGMGVGDLYDGGDFWVTNSGAGAAIPGMSAFADFTTGLVSFGSGSPPGGSITGAIAPATASVTGSIAGDIMTVTAVGSGTLVIGAPVAGGAASGTTILSQITPLLAGEALGGVGRYVVSIPGQSVASTTLTTAYGVLTVSNVSSGTVDVGSPVTGSGVTAGTTIVSPGTGTGGNGTYNVVPSQTVASETLSVGDSVTTKFYAATAGAVGELIKMTSSAPV